MPKFLSAFRGTLGSLSRHHFENHCINELFFVMETHCFQRGRKLLYNYIRLTEGYKKLVMCGNILMSCFSRTVSSLLLVVYGLIMCGIRCVAYMVGI